MATLGFVGTGTLAEAVIRGLQQTEASHHRFLLSPRSEETQGSGIIRTTRVAGLTVSRTSCTETPARKLTTIWSSRKGSSPNDPICDGSMPRSTMSLLANTIRAASNAEVVANRMIPLPCVEYGKGPILMTPADPSVEALFSPVGELAITERESELDTLAAASGLMSSHFQMQNAVIDWLTANGIPAAQSSGFVRSLYIGLGELALRDERRGGSLPPANYETAGGLNEAARVYLNGVGWFDEMAKVLDVIVAHRKTLAK